MLGESAQRPVLINALRVEPELGTLARGGLPATTARPVAGGWSLTGRKIYSTGAEGLRWMLVWARTEEPQPRVGSFLVRGGSPGITVEPTWDHLGLRASRSDDVIFDRTPVPGDAVIGLAGPALQAAADPVLTAWNSLGLTAIYLGVARAARDWLAGSWPADAHRAGPATGHAVPVPARGRGDQRHADHRGRPDRRAGRPGGRRDPVAVEHAGMAKSSTPGWPS